MMFAEQALLFCAFYCLKALLYVYSLVILISIVVPMHVTKFLCLLDRYSLLINQDLGNVF